MGELKALEKPPLRGQGGLAIFEKNAAASSLLGLQKLSPVSCECPPQPAWLGGIFTGAAWSSTGKYSHPERKGSHGVKPEAVRGGIGERGFLCSFFHIR